MRRMLALVLLLTLVAVIPAQAAAGKIAVPESAQPDALRAAKSIHSTTVAPGSHFSFNALVGDSSTPGASAVATALYLALRESGAVSFDELSYAPDNAGLFVNADHDFRFTNLATGTLHITFSASGDTLTCTIDIDESAATKSSAAGSGRPRKKGGIVSIDCSGDPALLNNVALAAGSIYDTTLATGDVFSFNAAIGPTTEACGYLPAADGRGETVTGGGVNRVASALWLLIQNRSDFVIVEKSTYGKRFSQTYVDHSTDAILTDYASDADFSFRYTGDGSVTLYAIVEEEILSVAIE